MATLIEYVVDSLEKLEVLVQLFRASPGALDARELGRCLALPPDDVAISLQALQQTGIVRRDAGDDDAGWRFNHGNTWVATVEAMVELYDLDREELLAFIKHVGFESLRPQLDRRSTVFGYLRRRRSRLRALPS